MPRPATAARGIPVRASPIHPGRRGRGATHPAAGHARQRAVPAVVAAARCSPRPRRGAPAWRGSSLGAAGAAAATACRGERCSSCSSCWRRRGGAVWFVARPSSPAGHASGRGAELRRRRGCGATRPGCGSCSTSAAAQPIRGPGSHASYGRPRARRRSRAFASAASPSERDGRFDLPDRHAHAHLRDAAGHDRAAGARRGRRGAGRVGAAPAPARPARRRAGAPGRADAPDARPGARRRRPAARRRTRRRPRIAGRAALGQRPRHRPRAPVRRAPGRHARARSCASATASSPRSSATGGARSTRPSGPGCSAPPRRRSGASSAAWPSCARATARCSRSPAWPSRPRSRPASTFKIITLSGALAAGIATPSSSLPGAHRPRRSRASRCATPAASRAAARSRRPSSTRATRSSRRSGAKLGAKRLVAHGGGVRLQRAPARPRRQAEHDPAGRAS